MSECRRGRSRHGDRRRHVDHCRHGECRRVECCRGGCCRGVGFFLHAVPTPVRSTGVSSIYSRVWSPRRISCTLPILLPNLPLPVELGISFPKSPSFYLPASHMLLLPSFSVPSSFLLLPSSFLLFSFPFFSLSPFCHPPFFLPPPSSPCPLRFPPQSTPSFSAPSPYVPPNI